jgi:vanillate O-demethylase monooxygenase subunit
MTPTMFPKNAWYVACTPNEIDDKPLGRTICGEKIVFYRAGGGKVAALEDFCPHRGAQLSLGQVCEGKLVCGYHGLVMGCDGKTVSMPGQRVGGFPKNRAYPVVERHGFIWVWPGDEQLADPAAIHHLEWADNPEWAYGGGLYHVACDYRLMVDNLMDLTHETYVHTTSIGQKEIDETPVTTKTEGDHVITSRFIDNVMPPPFWRANLRGNNLADDVLVDRWQVCHFLPPSHIMIEVGVAHAGKGGHNADAKDKVSSIVVDFLTPETETSMWYFWGMARNFNPKDKALTAQIREGQGKVFAEDTAVLEAQQRNLSKYPDRKLLMLNIDAGGVQSRRIIDRLVAAEQPRKLAA